MISSQAIEFEISNTPDVWKRDNLLRINKLASEVVLMTQEIRKRAKKFEDSGLQAFDAMHLASAEGNADIVLTTDDRFIKRSKNIQDVKIRVRNPLSWLAEILP